MEKFVREMLQRAEAAEQLNKLEPQARPEKPRSMAEMAHEQELARKKKQQEAGHNFNYKQHFINGYFSISLDVHNKKFRYICNWIKAIRGYTYCIMNTLA